MQMDLDENQNKFVIEEKDTSDVKFGSEVGNAPLVVVVQGGKNVNFFYNR
jgi:hypothetical protein